jgi:hypothetical protein
MALHMMLTFVVVHYLGLLYGVFHHLFVLSLFYWMAFQSRISDHFSRIYVGAYYGLMFSFFGDFLIHIRPLLSSITRFLLFFNFVAVLYLGYNFSAQKPAFSKAESQSEMCQKIIDSSPSEGTDSENNLLISDSNISKIQIVKDSFTGKVKVVRNKNDLDNLTEIRVRTCGPCLCGTCGCDKCVKYIPLSSSHTSGFKLCKDFRIVFPDVMCYSCSIFALLRQRIWKMHDLSCIALQLLRHLYRKR